jgi:hypothetical protein
MDKGSVFHSLAAAAWKDRSPYVLTVFLEPLTQSCVGSGVLWGVHRAAEVHLDRIYTCTCMCTII